jgi:hypothetical protein
MKTATMIDGRSWTVGDAVYWDKPERYGVITALRPRTQREDGDKFDPEYPTFVATVRWKPKLRIPTLHGSDSPTLVSAHNLRRFADLLREQMALVDKWIALQEEALSLVQ